MNIIQCNNCNLITSAGPQDPIANCINCKSPNVKTLTKEEYIATLYPFGKPKSYVDDCSETDSK